MDSTFILCRVWRDGGHVHSCALVIYEKSPKRSMIVLKASFSFWEQNHHSLELQILRRNYSDEENFGRIPTRAYYGLSHPPPHPPSAVLHQEKSGFLEVLCASSRVRKTLRSPSGWTMLYINGRSLSSKAHSMWRFSCCLLILVNHFLHESLDRTPPPLLLQADDFHYCVSYVRLLSFLR